jgi:small subunit ribosomal protein S10e
VLQAEKDFNLESHPEIESVPNLHVIKLMQSFKSKELVTERFAWRHYYWCDDSSRNSGCVGTTSF